MKYQFMFVRLSARLNYHDVSSDVAHDIFTITDINRTNIFWYVWIGIENEIQ
jgi:hypothetical protein